MRLIDADKLQKAILAEEDNITGMGMTYDEMKAYNDGIDKQWKKIVNAPTIEPEQKWIPCKDGEPKEYGEYRITWTTSVSKKRFIGDAEYEVSDEWDAKQDRFKGGWILDDYIKNYPDVKVIAWKPLEEPYRG